jgi:hypothetical protein
LFHQSTQPARGRLGLVDGAPGSSPPNELALVEAADSLCERGVIAVAARPGGPDRTGLREALGVANGDTLHAPVRGVNERAQVRVSVRQQSPARETPRPLAGATEITTAQTRSPRAKTSRGRE